MHLWLTAVIVVSLLALMGYHAATDVPVQEWNGIMEPITMTDGQFKTVVAWEM